ncbi:MAG: hypothetical protein FJ386_07365 [Verrucomicrobia bacterium]|nr:hypothetical protein [Verrucomicrobiota bacterium]
MAWRIEQSVVRGEIDNRVCGIVTGRLWLHGQPDPLQLELSGNACADLAGCLLTFENPAKTYALPKDARIAPTQRGSIGDLTASRKVKLPEDLDDESGRCPQPERVANFLFLEWFSETNGRVVIESPDFKLTISTPAWKLTPELEKQRQGSAEAAFKGFMEKVTEALERARHEPPEDKEWDEFDYEKLMRESDARTDKVMELMDKYRDHPDREKIIAREMGWEKLEEALEARERAESEGAANSDPDDDEPLFEAADASEVDELKPDPQTEGVDWVREEDGGVSHPLSLRAFNSSMDLWDKCDDLDVADGDDADLADLITSFQITSAKLSGALDSLAYGRDTSDAPFVVARLKRALGHLHSAQAALIQVEGKKLLPDELCVSTRRELFEIREEILRLMGEFRRSS